MRLALRKNGDPVEVRLGPDAGRALAQSGVVEAYPSLAPGAWTVRPLGKVGVARVAGVELWIEPKLTIRRLFFLLGFLRRGTAWRDEDLPLAEAADLLTVVADAFARQAERALSQGLLQGYRVTEDVQPVLRGRLREADQMRRRFGMPVPAEIRFDDYTIDIAENQLLLAAIRRLLVLPGLTAQLRRRLQHLLVRLADVTLLVRGRALPRWQPTRLNARYHVAVRLAELVARGGSVELASARVPINGLLLDMPRVFEDFLTSALTAACTAYGGQVRAQDRWHLDEAQRIAIRPDIVWYAEPGRPGAVVDAKYKAKKPSGLPDADLCQMLAYCTELRLPRGHLVYAKGNEAAARHVVAHAGIEIVQHVLELDQEPEPAGPVAELARDVCCAGGDRTGLCR